MILGACEGSSEGTKEKDGKALGRMLGAWLSDGIKLSGERQKNSVRTGCCKIAND